MLSRAQNQNKKGVLVQPDARKHWALMKILMYCYPERPIVILTCWARSERSIVQVNFLLLFEIKAQKLAVNDFHFCSLLLRLNVA